MSLIGFIGTGNMGGALARAVGKTGHSLLLSDADAAKCTAVRDAIGECARVSDNEEIFASCDMIFLGLKPQMLAGFASMIAPAIEGRARSKRPHLCLVSMAAGTSTEKIATLFSGLPVIRIMPNTPASVGEGMILHCAGENVTDADETLFLDALRFAGKPDAIPERLIDAASAISGCGPAFACLFVEALADGGVRCGLPRDKAQAYAVQMLKGTAALIEQSGQHPGALKDAVCSPGGTTIEGVMALEDGAFRSAVASAVIAAYERTLELK